MQTYQIEIRKKLMALQILISRKRMAQIQYTCKSQEEKGEMGQLLSKIRKNDYKYKERWRKRRLRKNNFKFFRKRI